MLILWKILRKYWIDNPLMLLIWHDDVLWSYLVHLLLHLSYLSCHILVSRSYLKTPPKLLYFVNLFLANVLILYPLKTPKKISLYAGLDSKQENFQQLPSNLSERTQRLNAQIGLTLSSPCSFSFTF